MPLPDGAVLSVQVQPNLGNAVQSKPKRAMIVRMSAETLEALEAFPNHPEMSVDFSDNPGIYVGESFFPMLAQKEKVEHELYLRAASAAKPMAPLKLYANVIGKFIVERQLGDEVRKKVRQQTIAAKQQHTERQAIHLDQPLIPPVGSKTGKRKTPGSGTVVKKTPASSQLQVPSSSTLAARKLSPLPQNPPSSKANTDVRQRLIRCLVTSPRTADEAVKMVAGAKCTDRARKELLALLYEIAEEQGPTKKGDKSPRPWSLKLQTWLEVRPYEWPILSESERTLMCRQARIAFNAFKIPESDPVWDHVRYRQTGPAIPQSAPVPPPLTSSSSRSSSSAQAETKRPAISSKDTKSKSKQDATRSKGEIQMKDESAKPTPSRVNPVKRVEADRPSTPSDAGGSAKSVPSRRLPGSGYQVKKSPQPTSSGEKLAASKQSAPVPASLPPKPATAPPPAGGSHARKTIPTIPPKPAKREDDSDKERDREYERVRERERIHREKEKERERQRIERERGKEMEKREAEKREAEKREAEKREQARREEKRKQREREEMEQEVERRLKEKEKEREKERLAKAASSTAIKRKTATQDPPGDASPDPTKAPIPKRRRLDDTASAPTPTSSSSKVRDPGLPKKPSPLPPPRASPSTHTSAAKSERPKPNNTKFRRKSPIYTSSEDEGEIPQPRKRNSSPPPVSDRSTSDQPSEKQPQTRHRPRASYPTDRNALRTLYQSQYPDYLAAFSKAVSQKIKIEAVLNGDAEAEADLMEPEELHQLNLEYKSRKEELEHISELYLKASTTGAGGSSD